METRPAIESDLPAIAAIYNHEILTSTSVYTDEPQTLEQRREWFTAKKDAGMPVFVLEDGDGVAGFGTYGRFRNFTGYRFCVEHSIYIAEAKRRLGYGKLLLATLIEAASDQGMHTMIAGVDGRNEGSIRLHLAFGFSQVGYLQEVGHKFNQWLDLVFLQKILETRNKLASL